MDFPIERVAKKGRLALIDTSEKSLLAVPRVQIEDCANRYKSVSRFKAKYPLEYAAAVCQGIKHEVCAHMAELKHQNKSRDDC